MASLIRVGIVTLVAVGVGLGILGYVFVAETGAFSDPVTLGPGKPLPKPKPVDPPEVGAGIWPPSEGERYPDFTLIDTRGNEVQLASFSGQPLLIEYVGMPCPGSQGLAGGSLCGGFGGMQPQPRLASIDTLLRRYGKIEPTDERLQLVSIIFYDMKMKPPTAESLQAWEKHFGLDKFDNMIVLGGRKEHQHPTIRGMTPGFHLVDREFNLRAIVTNGSETKICDLLREAKRVAYIEATPEDWFRTPNPKVVGKVAEAFRDHPSRPLPKESRRLKRELDRHYPAYVARLMVDPYLQQDDADKSKDSDELALLQQVAQLYPKQGTSEQVELAFEHGRRAVESGGRDPLVLTAYGYVLWRKKVYHRAEEVLRDAAELFPKSDYPILTRRLAPLFLGKVLVGTNDLFKQREAGKWNRQACHEYVEAAKGPFTPEEKRFYGYERENILYDHIPDRNYLIAKAIVADGRADPWIRDLVLGAYHQEIAWAARGSGYARTVTDEGWRYFGLHQEASRAYYLDAWDRHPELPEGARQLARLSISRGGVADETMRFWFDETVAAQFDYYPAYEHMRWGKRPRWGGTHHEMIAFGVECLNTHRFDTYVPFCFYDVINDIGGELSERSDAFRMPGIYENFRDLYEGALAEPSFDVQQRFNLKTKYAGICWLCGEYDEAARLLLELGPNISTKSLEEIKVPLVKMLADLPEVAPPKPAKDERVAIP
ncbi:hypothetical protein Pan216_52400 [Planctomycetes bacterium Pan216]|uniref:Thioredoxin domain-containing protein n=1 Tax=Kolteria novifilia TaxID=2527975 RepID=A0A518BBI9_9BACT|nr:hypothetical protein Pan216_52400 [Planctomycetes bacterium Pan216]